MIEESKKDLINKRTLPNAGRFRFRVNMPDAF